jgi:hypothetical protein
MSKTVKLKPFEKLLTLMVSGEPVTKDEIDQKLGAEIYVYRLSTYIWHIKTIANGTVRAIKDGRQVVAYQLVNVKEVQKYLDTIGIAQSTWVPGQKVKKPSAAKLAAQTGATPMPAMVDPVAEEVQVNETVEQTA